MMADPAAAPGLEAGGVDPPARPTALDGSAKKRRRLAVDLVARIGGEEFLVAIPNSDAVHARTAAERLCNLISGAPFYVGQHRSEVSVTMSVGVSLSPPDKTVNVPQCLEELVNAADLALFDAKNSGRNTVSLSAA
jgi:two-component system cell cycle response regulator